MPLCTGSWTPGYLCPVIGQKRLTVAIAKDDGVFGYSTVGRSYVTERLEFSTVVNHRKVPTATKYYIMKTPVHEDLPELARDIQNPSGLQTADLEALNFWLSSADDVTPLHYDISNSFLAQIYGRKEITLFSPDQYRYLYPYPAAASHPHVSRVNFVRPDYADFPLLEKANGINLILEAGDLLVLPAF